MLVAGLSNELSPGALNFIGYVNRRERRPGFFQVVLKLQLGVGGLQPAPVGVDRERVGFLVRFGSVVVGEVRCVVRFQDA